ncbi:MAG: class II aldolase/adducin family protein [Clostridia bacterium]|nr:class II aldolase/adducin family protein [Clostridia bacterium]
MTDIEKKLIADMIDVGNKMYLRGFVAANDGNLSVRCPDGESALVTPTGVSKGGMTEDMFIKVRISDGAVLEGTCKASSESKMHLRLYRENPNICAVVHAHPLYATSFAIARQPLDAPIYPAAMMNLGTVPVADYSPPGTEGVAEAVAPFAKDYRALLLASHGALTWASDILTAWYRMEELENYAHITFNTLYVMKQATEVPIIDRLPDKK